MNVSDDRSFSIARVHGWWNQPRSWRKSCTPRCWPSAITVAYGCVRMSVRQPSPESKRRAGRADARVATATNPSGVSSREAVYREQRFTASCMHFHSPSNPQTALRRFLP